MTQKIQNNNSNSKIKILQFASSIGRPSKQKATLLGLGLRKINSISLLNDTSSIRGMIHKVKHLVRIIKI